MEFSKGKGVCDITNAWMSFKGIVQTIFAKIFFLR